MVSTPPHSCIARTDAAGLDNVSGGRAILGIGASGPQVIEGWHGLPYVKPLGRIREIVDLVRRALRREVLSNDGIIKIPLPEGEGTGLGKPLKILNHPERSTVPIYIAALGKKSVASAAEIADGWLPFLYAPERAGLVWGDALAAGKAKRSADLGPLEIAAGGMVAVGDDAKGKNFYNNLVSEYGFAEEAEKIQDLYLAGNKKDAEALVPLELLEMCNLVGPESYVKERIAAFKESGVTNLNITPVAQDPAALIGRLKEWIG